MLYNLSEFMTLIKEDIGIKDIPLPVDDVELVKRFQNSALKEFSVRYPRIEEVMLGVSDAVNFDNIKYNGSVTYIIPQEYYQDSKILAVLGVDQGDRSGSAATLYMPSVYMGSADNLLMSIADIKLAAAMGAQMQHAITFRFIAPNKLIVFNGWAGARFRAELAMLHDVNLSTIPDTAMTHLRQLTILDIQSYLYNKLKRKTTLDTGIGNIDLKIENWENSQQEMRDLLQRWDEEGASLDLDTINYW